MHAVQIFIRFALLSTASKLPDSYQEMHRRTQSHVNRPKVKRLLYTVADYPQISRISLYVHWFGDNRSNFYLPKW